MKHICLLPLLASALLAYGCDAARDLADPDRLQDRLREDPTRPGKVGAVVGVTVHQRAIRVANATRKAPSPGCSIELGPGRRYEMTLELKRNRGTVLVSSWKEERAFAVDAAGDLSLESTASFVSEIGERGTVINAWRVVGDDSFHGTPARDGMLWYRRDADDDERARMRAAGTATLQALLDIAGPWRREQDRWQTDPAGTPLFCAPADEGRGWVDRFVARASLRNATLSGDEARRQFVGSWELEDGSVISARLEDRVGSYDENVSAPPAEAIVEVTRERSLGTSVALLDKLAERGLVEVASPPKQPEEPPR